MTNRNVTESAKRVHFAGHSYMGTNFTYDSPCWKVLMFKDQKTRDDYVSDDWEHREKITRAKAARIYDGSRQLHEAIEAGYLRYSNANGEPI